MHLIPALKALWRDRRGNMLMIFAFSVVPIAFATGMGIDYTGAMRLQTRLNAVTDAAALAGVTSPMMKQKVDKACMAARSTFQSQAVNIRGLSIDMAQATDLTITITDNLPDGSVVTTTCPVTGDPAVSAALPLSRTATVTYKARSANNFAAILGRASLGIGGTATSKTTLAPYIDIYMALDTSQSMGLAATDADAKSLFTATLKVNGVGCQFGCHEPSPGQPKSMEQVARDNNIKMRVDILRDASLDMIDTAALNQADQKLYRFGLYRIGVEFTSAANVINPLTDNLVDARSKVSALTLGRNDGSVGFGDTNLTAMLDNLKPMMGPSGDGTSAAKPRAFLFIVTDGVQDLCWNAHCTSVIESGRCQKYKDAGITVGIVYTTFLPIKENPTDPNNNNLNHDYKRLVVPLPPSTIAPALQACASPGWFFEGSDAATIHSAMTNLFRQATQTPSITR